MKIAYVYDAVYPWIKGGVERRIYEIGRRLVSKGYDVHWFGIGWWGNKEHDLDGIKLHPVCKPQRLYVGRRRSIKEAVVFALNLLTKLFKYDLDVIDCQVFPYFPTFSSNLYTLIRQRRLILTWHEVWQDYWYEYLGLKGFFGKVVENLTARIKCDVIAVSERTLRDLILIGVNNAKLIPNGIDFEKIRQIEPASLESDIIFAGRLIRDKNVNLLLEAVRILKDEIRDLTCLIIGDGPEKDRLCKLALELDLDKNVRFLNFLEYDTLISLMKSSKVFVLPSTREGFGVTALEANACGLPVVTVRHRRNAVTELVRRGCGILCDLNAKDLAEKITIAIEKRKRIKRRCVECARQYDWNRIVKLIVDLYEGKCYSPDEG
ncbi:glycosyltransferase family 4 protein [Archaeoglobus profundus]|uniref:Glycosyl transferase group 1 n=1 Tax=Archaeoglobus profundus (strain DSM 5631 / JCM 9629 / NBRC 100127 / Av18) TaxID=572546 RepID=D2RDQ4_ARCPA|nr:glycosyltransferase family 4 protein [Archaeoglobus profundus]ADB58248.1 glycosyl transferase group 1 [Archaeoglobus profundus DSM 5631]